MACSIPCPYCGYNTSHSFQALDQDDEFAVAETVICGDDDGGCYEPFSALPDGRIFAWMPVNTTFPAKELPARFSADPNGRVYLEYLGDHASMYSHVMAVAPSPHEAKYMAHALNATYRRFDCREHGASATG